jgi:hypothetical protein
MQIYVSFKINQDNIAKALCVKKEVKNNGCQGKCHLKKQLEKSDEEEQKQAPTTAFLIQRHKQPFGKSQLPTHNRQTIMLITCLILLF